MPSVIIFGGVQKSYTHVLGWYNAVDGRLNRNMLLYTKICV